MEAGQNIHFRSTSLLGSLSRSTGSILYSRSSEDYLRCELSTGTAVYYATYDAKQARIALYNLHENIFRFVQFDAEA